MIQLAWRFLMFQKESALALPTLISYCSDWTPLVAGDVISTGTPEGVGFARKPPLWMKPGDVVEVEIDGGVGVLRNRIIAEA